MDTFFRRHFRRKEAALPAGADSNSAHQRRPSVAVPTSKARRRSNAGLPSSTLSQRRRPGVQLPEAPTLASGGRLAGAAGRDRWAGEVRRRSSTTTPNLNPRFAMSKRNAGKLRTIDRHLLGPSMLLASLIQMAEEEGAGLPAGERQVDVMSSRSSSLLSIGDESSIDHSDDGQSEAGQLSEAEQLVEEEDDNVYLSRFSSFGPRAREAPRSPPASRPLIRPPRCLRRNSGDGGAPLGRHRASGQRRRISTISKAGSPWPGRGPPPRLPNRRTSVHCLNHPASCRGPGAPSLLEDPRLESWSCFLLYVD